MLALGIDVGLDAGLDGKPKKGQHLVFLDTSRSMVATYSRVSVPSIADLIAKHDPDVIAIDSPPLFAKDARRKTEVLLQSRGVHLFATPWLPAKQDSAFYGWMRDGSRIFKEAATAGYPLFDGGANYRHTAFEVFPHAVAVVLSGSLRPRGCDKFNWRKLVLSQAKVETHKLTTIDLVDAGLAALTGLIALEGGACWSGEPSEGVIVLPCRESELREKYVVSPSLRAERSNL